MSGRKRLTIGIAFDLVCPWCYIGKRQLDLARARFAAEFPGVVVETTWHPVQLLPEVPEQGLPFAEFYARRLGSPEGVRQRREQVAQAARNAGLDLDLTRIERMPNTARAHRLLRQFALLDEPERYEALLERLFAAYFRRGEDIGDAATLRRLAAETGVWPDRLPDASPVVATQAPAGVPYFVFNGRVPLAGAHDADTLLMAMRQAMPAKAASGVA